MSARTAGSARLHTVRTPEGLSLPFVVAPAGDRAAAFLLDLLVIGGATVVVMVVSGFLLASGLENLGLSFGLLAGFLLWNFYFIGFEARGGGLTFGKRRVGLRVISRHGGPLTAEAVFARNLTRNLEFNLAVVALLAPEALFPSVPEGARGLAVVWILVFALMPLFNRDRLRCGDLVAGTLVVKEPVAVLLADLAERPAVVRRAAEPGEEGGFTFTPQQLDIYGVHELQVLEDLLRRQDEGTLDGQILEDVCEKIKTKIGWPMESWHVPLRPFLEAFYRAQRKALEQKMLFGQRRERKRA